MHSRKSRQIFECGYIIAGRYRILKLIGQGGYGDIYSVEEITDEEFNNSSSRHDKSNFTQNPRYAMKIESLTAEKKGLDLEIEILSELQDSPFFPHVHERGMTQTHRFLVMELFGPSISNTRRQMPSHKFSLGTVLRLGIFMIECIRSFHQHGFVHRDIKPGNFLLRCPQYLTESQSLPTIASKTDEINNSDINSINDKDKNRSNSISQNADNSQSNPNSEQNNNIENVNNNNDIISNNNDNSSNNNVNINNNNDSINNNNDDFNNSKLVLNEDTNSTELIKNDEYKTITSNKNNNNNMISNPLALIDFGLSKRYIDPETSLPYPEKSRAGFRGTCKYASIYAHNFHDQCPRDDLISWCYSIVELIEGYLPWGNLRENSRVRQIKSQFLPKTLFRSLPREFLEIWRYLNSLSYNIAVPKYDYIIQLVAEPFYNYIFNKNNRISSSNLIMESNDIVISNENKNKNYVPFDWEILSREQIESYSGVSSLPSARDVPLPPRIGGGLITENDDTQEFGKGSRCFGCLII